MLHTHTINKHTHGTYSQWTLAPTHAVYPVEGTCIVPRAKHTRTHTRMRTQPVEPQPAAAAHLYFPLGIG